ncbi:unnamed protein product [Malus baccata var. baccata]
MTPNLGNDKCRGELGNILGSKYWDEGIAIQVVNLVIDTIIKEWTYLVRLEAFVDMENVGSYRVLEKVAYHHQVGGAAIVENRLRGVQIRKPQVAGPPKQVAPSSAATNFAGPSTRSECRRRLIHRKIEGKNTAPEKYDGNGSNPLTAPKPNTTLNQTQIEEKILIRAKSDLRRRPKQCTKR